MASLLPMAAGMGVLFSLVAFSEGLYQGDQRRRFPEMAWALAKLMGWVTVVAVMLLGFPGPYGPISVQKLLVGSVAEYLLLLAWKAHQSQKAAQRGSVASAQRKVLIAGAGPAGRRLAASLHQSGALAFTGFLDNHAAGRKEVLGRIEDLAQVARAHFVDELWIATTYPYDLVRRMIQEAKQHHLDVRIAPDLYGSNNHVSVHAVGGVPLLTLSEQKTPDFQLFCKRCLDVAFGVILLFIAAPIMGFCALLVHWDSPGPILYRARRMGRKAVPFVCYKFRTMRKDADEFKERLRTINERRGATFKIGSDPRITRIGRFLRRYSLDELPQLWNVLIGDMSLVGPRPHPLDDFARYTLGDLRRLDVAPGLTGLWQIMARQDPSFERNVSLDLEYIEKWSLWLDFRILLKTSGVVLRGSGA
jgi:exopolysaccharide biosynthesis polyprenyl glycosylphosphotransferase